MVAYPYDGRCVLVDLVRKVGREQRGVRLSDPDVGAVEITVVEERLSVQVILTSLGPSVAPDVRLVEPQSKHGNPDVACIVNRG